MWAVFVHCLNHSNQLKSMPNLKVKISLQTATLDRCLGRYIESNEMSIQLSRALVVLIERLNYVNAARKRGVEKEPAFTDLPMVTDAIRESILKHTDSGCFLLDGVKLQLCEIDDLKHEWRSRLQIYEVGCLNCRIRTFESPPPPAPPES